MTTSLNLKPYIKRKEFNSYFMISEESMKFLPDLIMCISVLFYVNFEYFGDHTRQLMITAFVQYMCQSIPNPTYM